MLKEQFIRDPTMKSKISQLWFYDTTIYLLGNYFAPWAHDKQLKLIAVNGMIESLSFFFFFLFTGGKQEAAFPLTAYGKCFSLFFSFWIRFARLVLEVLLSLIPPPHRAEFGFLFHSHTGNIFFYFQAERSTNQRIRGSCCNAWFPVSFRKSNTFLSDSP